MRVGINKGERSWMSKSGRAYSVKPDAVGAYHALYPLTKPDPFEKPYPFKKPDPLTKSDSFTMITPRTLPPPGEDIRASLLEQKETSRETIGVWTLTHSLVTAPHVEETLVVSRVHAKLRALVVDEERFFRDRSRVLPSA